MKRDQSDQCSAQFVVDSQVFIKYIQNVPLAEAHKLDDPVQLKPQRVSLSNARNGTWQLKNELEKLLSRFDRFYFYCVKQGKLTPFRSNSNKPKIIRLICIF